MTEFDSFGVKIWVQIRLASPARLATWRSDMTCLTAVFSAAVFTGATAGFLSVLELLVPLPHPASAAVRTTSAASPLKRCLVPIMWFLSDWARSTQPLGVSFAPASRTRLIPISRV